MEYLVIKTFGSYCEARDFVDGYDFGMWLSLRKPMDDLPWRPHVSYSKNPDADARLRGERYIVSIQVASFLSSDEAKCFKAGMKMAVDSPTSYLKQVFRASARPSCDNKKWEVTLEFIHEVPNAD